MLTIFLLLKEYSVLVLHINVVRKSKQIVQNQITGVSIARDWNSYNSSSCSSWIEK